MTKNEVAYPILSYEDFLESDLKIHTHLVSDLDGTLVLSKKATQAAYKEAGKELQIRIGVSPPKTGGALLTSTKRNKKSGHASLTC